MATNAYGRDFYIGLVFHSRDKREPWRHVRICDLLSGRAVCQTYIPQTGQLYSNRKTKISLRALAGSRWEYCNEKRPCSFCQPQQQTAEGASISNRPTDGQASLT